MSFASACLNAYLERFLDFGPPFASQKLRELYDLDVDHETLRRWLVEEGLWKRRKKRGPHRKKRPRPRRSASASLCRLTAAITTGSATQARRA